MGLIALSAKRRNFPVETPIPLRELPGITWRALPALMMPVVLLGGIYSGVTTPTEAAAVAAAYALIVSAALYRSISWRDLYLALLNSARMTASIGILIAAAIVFNYVVTVENIPKTLAAMLQGVQFSPLMFLLVVNLILLVLGCFLEGTTIILIIIPVLLAHRPGAGDRPGAFRGGRGRQHHARPDHAALRPAALPHGEDRGGAPQGSRARRHAVSRRRWSARSALITVFPDLVLYLPRLLGYTG